MQQSSASVQRSPFLSSPYLIALFSALIFVTHPVQTQAVTYIVQRLASLAALFYLASLVLYIKGRLNSQEPGPKTETAFFFIASFLSAVLAMKTKEIAFTLPVSIMLYEWIFFTSTLKKRLLFLSPFLLTLLIIPLSTMGINKPLGEILSDVNEHMRLQTHIGRWDYFVTQISVITTYIRLLFLPIDQNLDYDYPIFHSLLTPRVFLSLLFLLSMLGAAVYFLVRSNRNSRLPIGSSPLYARLTAFGVFWFFITLSVESSIVPIADVIFEHRAYLPSVGLIIAFTALLFLMAGKVFTEKKAISVIVAVFSLMVVVLCGTAYARNEVWKSGITLFQDVVRKSPDKARPYLNLGVWYNDSAQYDDALVQLNRAVALNPAYAAAFYNLAVTYANRSQYDKVIEASGKAIALDPAVGGGGAYLFLGLAYSITGLDEKAIDAYSKGIDANPDLIVAYNNLSLVYYKKGAFDKALEKINTAIALNENYTTAYNTRGLVYMKRGNTAGAFEDFQLSCNRGNKEGCRLLQSVLKN